MFTVFPQIFRCFGQICRRPCERIGRQDGTGKLAADGKGNGRKRKQVFGETADEPDSTTKVRISDKLPIQMLGRLRVMDARKECSVLDRKVAF